jgi:1-acyl-sn-glycerol-3-phosphate acyltransferase
MRVNLSEWFLRRLFWVLTTLLCKIDDRQVDKVPDKGPWVLVTNHVNVLEIPVIYTRLRPRPISGFFAAYRLESLWMRWLLYAFGGIPVRRGEPDLTALRQAVERIRAGAMFALAPEGTRNPQGKLQQGKAGVVLLAQWGGAPIQPIVHYGDANWQQNLKRLRRVPFNIAVGRPFRIVTHDQRVTAPIRQEIVDEIMLQMASLLPEAYHGYYAGRTPTTRYLQFLDETEM